MVIFKKKETKEKVVTASAPEELDSKAEAMYTKKMDNEADPEKKEKTITKDIAQQPQVEIREVPVIMSEAQKWNIVIENNMLLKHLVSKTEEE